MLAVAQIGRPQREVDPDPAFLTPRTPGTRSHAAAVLQVLDAMGYSRQPWLDRLLPEALAVDSDGAWVHSDVTVTVPRQAGKSTLMGPVMGHRALAIQRAACWLTAQTRGFASDLVVQEWGGRFADVGAKIRRATGSESAAFGNGSSIRPFPPSADGLHGRYAHLVGVDEVWAMGDGEALEQAVRPTLTTTAGQVWWVSTAGDATSGLLRRLVAAGRGGHGFLAEWTLPPEVAAHVEDLLHVRTPAAVDEAVDLVMAYHPGTFAQRAGIRAAAGSMTPGSFLRAYGNVETTAGNGMIPAQRWAQRRWQGQAGPWPTPTRPLFLGVAADPVGGGASINAAWRWRDRVLLDVIQTDRGTEWLPEAVARWAQRLRPRKVAVDGNDPAAASVETAVLAHGLARNRVDVLTSNEYALACARLVDAVASGEVTHPDDERLTTAVVAGSPRQLGDRWVWDRRAAEVAPLVAATVAMRSLERNRDAADPTAIG